MQHPSNINNSAIHKMATAIPSSSPTSSYCPTGYSQLLESQLQLVSLTDQSILEVHSFPFRLLGQSAVIL